MRSWAAAGARLTSRTLIARWRSTAPPTPSWWRWSLCSPRYSSCQAEQAIKIEVRVKVRREPIERLFDQFVIGDGGRAGRQAAEPSRTLTIIGEQSVDICPEHAAVGRNGTLGRAVVEPRERPRAIGARRNAHMHFITAKRNAAIGRATDRFEPLVSGENGFDIKQAEPGDFAGRSLDPLRVGHRPPQHLIAAAQTEHQSAAAPMPGDIDVKAGGAQRS